jgi:D-alanine-D-alanine ligase-like ATP-grasp enzyme
MPILYKPFSSTGLPESEASLVGIKYLLRKKQKEFEIIGRDTKIKIKDIRIVEKLKSQGLSLNSIVKKDERIYLLDNANLSSGGDSLDVTDNIHPDFYNLAINLTRDMGLSLCGVDLMIDGDISEKPDKYCVLEINSSPGLDNYVKNGEEQKKIVENMYLEVLKVLEKRINS